MLWNIFSVHTLGTSWALFKHYSITEYCCWSVFLAFCIVSCYLPKLQTPKLISDASIVMWMLDRKHLSIGKNAYIDWCERMNEVCCVKRIEHSSRIQKHYITGIPFTVAAPLWPKCILLLQSHQISVQLRCAADKSACMMLSCQYGPNIWEVFKHPVESMPWGIKAVLKNKKIPASTSKVYPLKCTHVIAAVLKLQVGGISHQQNILAMTFKKQGNQSHWVCPIFQQAFDLEVGWQGFSKLSTIAVVIEKGLNLTLF